MKKTLTYFTALIVMFVTFSTMAYAQGEGENDRGGSKLTIVSGFKGGSNYQMAMDMQKMTRKLYGTTKMETKTYQVPVLGPKGDTLREKSEEPGVPGPVKMEEKTEQISTGDTVDFLNVLTSEGSYYNFLKITKSDVDISFMQYDVLLYEAMQDIKRQYKKAESIRVLLPLGTEQIHIITLKPDGKKGITTFADLKGKKVGIGSSLMGTNVTAKYIKEVTGSKWEDVEIPFDKAIKALFNETIDAFFYVGAKPVIDLASISVTMRDKITIVSIPQNEKLDRAYQRVTITTEDYKWLSENVETYAVKSLLVTSLAGQTPEIEADIVKLLEAIKANKDNPGYHSNWKNVTFTKDETIDWEYYPAALKVY